jgi:hypothetical protein
VAQPSEATQATWEDVANLALSQLKGASLDSKTIRSVVARGVKFVDFQDKNREIVFDKRALFLGLLSAGLQDRDSSEFGNTASWFAAWLERKVGQGAMAQSILGRAMTPPEVVLTGVSDGYRVILSESVQGFSSPRQGSHSKR